MRSKVVSLRLTVCQPCRLGALVSALLLSALPAVAQETAPRAGSIPANLLPHDLSVWGMFAQADVVVKAVMLGLAFASVITWTVLLAKGIEIATARRRVSQALQAAETEPTLARLRQRVGDGGAGGAMVSAALQELKLSADGTAAGTTERTGSRLQRIEAALGRRMSRGTGVLATIGSTAPFVGLFGTVWGIMNSFIGIAKSQTTSLAVVAPGIAEALLATAIGLVAAIPAVVIYNLFARQITAYRAGLADLSAAVLRTCSRDLDVRRPPPLHAAAE